MSRAQRGGGKDWHHLSLCPLKHTLGWVASSWCTWWFWVSLFRGVWEIQQFYTWWLFAVISWLLLFLLIVNLFLHWHLLVFVPYWWKGIGWTYKERQLNPEFSFKFRLSLLWFFSLIWGEFSMIQNKFWDILKNCTICRVVPHSGDLVKLVLCMKLWLCPIPQSLLHVVAKVVEVSS